jgi:hypothetical protein
VLGADGDGDGEFSSCVEERPRIGRGFGSIPKSRAERIIGGPPASCRRVPKDGLRDSGNKTKINESIPSQIAVTCVVSRCQENDIQETLRLEERGPKKYFYVIRSFLLWPKKCVCGFTRFRQFQYF